MRTLAIVAASVAGFLHIVVFVAEAFAWHRPVVWRAFGATSMDDARSKAVTMLNLGFYNLFLGLGSIGGAILLASHRAGGVTLLLYACGFMVGAGVVLVAKARAMWIGAVAQAGPPLVAILAVVAS